MNETKKSHGHEEHDMKNMSMGFVDDMMNEAQEIDEGKNKPTNPKLWSRAKSMAKSKFKVYPSAYANGWAAKWYKSKGGEWTKTKN
jgi:hypothetical protein